MRGEVAALRAELSTRRQRRSILDAARRIIAAVCVMLAAFALVASVVGVWAARTVLDTDRWVAAVAPLPEDPAVATAVAQYSTDQLFEVLDVETRLREALPPRAGFVIGPLTVQLRGVIRTQVLNIVSSERFQTVWEEANRRAHQRALAIIEGRSTLITASDDQVRIDLLPLINQVLQRIETQLPTFFGRSLSLPDLRSGEIPPNLRERIETALGVSLPANFAQFTVYDAGRLRAVQETVVAVRQGLIALVLGAIALLLIALAIAPRRRRTLLQLGIWLAVAAVAVTAVLRAARAELLQQVPDGVYRDGVAATLTIVTAPLRDRGLLVIAAGVLIALVAYLVGPGRVPVALRRGIARGTRSAGRGTARGGRWLAAHGPGWIRRYRDPLRIGGAVVAALAVILVSSWSGLLVIVVLLVVYEVAVTLIARSPSETVPTEPRPPQTESPAPARG
ncbi:hypothetical protein [Cryptosporangium aurantiacum]|uniref:hypothetical protein n=1 Tax=Cryptosporangium aurantiacum TaxID=134849 RepID=UPI001C49F382|nr:hypothetical protein [Cryptosporangium aurantiacum]